MGVETCGITRKISVVVPQEGGNLCTSESSFTIRGTKDESSFHIDTCSTMFLAVLFQMSINNLNVPHEKFMNKIFVHFHNGVLLCFFFLSNMKFSGKC